ncbi:MAG TPA: M23 family metallopeptidase [Sphingobium sp.]|nr:M23 family metallopeptidase [Sphingobium sp.]
MGQSGGAGTVALGGFAAPAPLDLNLNWRQRIAEWAQDVDLTPDLGRNIGTLHWWRGLATCTALCATMLFAAPGMAPVPGYTPPPLTGAQFDQLRAQMITPLALGADSGRRMGPTDAVAPLAATPERPSVELNAVIGVGDSFSRALQRAGVSAADANQVRDLIGGAVDPDSIAQGTRVNMTLGRRANRSQPRPLDALSVRARFDLALEIVRQNGVLAMKQIPIAVDDTPLRIRGTVGGSLYAAARAAGADPETIQSYLKVLSQRLSISEDIGAEDKFDLIVEHRRAATGETETGKLLFAGLERTGRRAVNMLRWTVDGRDQWFEASGVGERRGVLASPVAGRLTSGFGMRFHPLLRYSRMHQGVDFGAPTGTPIYAVTTGVVAYAGRHGGHGNYVRINHGGGLATGYAHMSRIAAYPGERVRQGQIIGYVGSTGLSTGPHLHYEVYRNGATVNPMSVRFTQAAQLAGSQLAAFKAKLARLKGLPVGLPAATFATPAGTVVAGGGRMPLAR